MKGKTMIFIQDVLDAEVLSDPPDARADMSLRDKLDFVKVARSLFGTDRAREVWELLSLPMADGAADRNEDRPELVGDPIESFILIDCVVTGMDTDRISQVRYRAALRPEPRNRL